MFKRSSYSLEAVDPEIWAAMQAENRRQEEHIELIASENYASPAVMAAQGGQMTNKYAEGYPGKRYYGGCEHVDVAETLALERLKRLFGLPNIEIAANVQPHAGAQANEAVFLALLNPGDTIMGMDLSHGGHLTHGSPVNVSGKWFKAVHYGVSPATEQIDYDQVLELAKLHRPRVLICGYSAYPRTIHFDKLREIADAVGCYLWADMAHIAGLVAGGVHPSPIPYCDVVTTTTHKTLRGPRGGLILTRNAELGKKLDKAVFPGTQGGPLEHVIAAKAVAFGEALQPEFKHYVQRVVANAQAMAQQLQKRGLRIVSGGTDNHLMLVDLRSVGLTGKVADLLISEVNITANKNTIPFDPAPPAVSSGLRFGAPAMTTRGLGTAEFVEIAHIIADRLSQPEDETVEQDCSARVKALCDRFPLYPELGSSSYVESIPF